MSKNGKNKSEQKTVQDMGVIRLQGDGDTSSSEADEPTAVIVRIRQAVDELDAEKLNIKELKALVADVQHLIDTAEVQENIQERIKDWETQHAAMIAGATDTVALNALKNLESGIKKGKINQEDVSTALKLIHEWLLCDVAFQEKHEKLVQAANDANFALVKSLNSTLESLKIERDQLRAQIVGEPAKPRPGGLTPDAKSSGDGHPEDSEQETKDADDPHAAEKLGDLTDDTARFDKRADLRMQSAIVRAIERNRFGLAYHLSLKMPNAVPSANAIKLAAYSRVLDEHTPATDELPELAGALLDEAREKVAKGNLANPSWRSHVVFTTCAALLPALTAPGRPIAQLLDYFDQWLTDMPSLKSLAKTATDFNLKSDHLPMHLLRERDSREKWQEKKKQLYSETESWINSEKHTTLKSQAATRVWKRIIQTWKRENGQHSLGYIFDVVLGKSISNVDINNIIKTSSYWRDSAGKEIDRIDREIRGSNWKNKIEGRVRVNLRNKINRSLALSDRWLKLLEERPDRVQTFQKKEIKKLRASVQKINQSLIEIDKTPINQHLKSAQKKLLQRYEAFFCSSKHEEAYARSRPVGLNDLLNGDLLADPQIKFDDNFDNAGQPINCSVESLLNLVENLPNLVLDAPSNSISIQSSTAELWATAAEDRARLEDFSNAEAAVDVAERTRQIDDVRADWSRGVIAGRRERSQRKLKNRIKKVSRRLDTAYAVGVLDRESYDLYRDIIPQDDLRDVNVFDSLFADKGELETIDVKITDAEENWRVDMRKWLEKKQKNLSQKDQERIESTINSDRFRVAEDYKNRIDSGHKLPSLEAVDRPFDEFFPVFVKKYTKLCDEEGYGISRVRDIIDQRGFDEYKLIDARNLSKDASADGTSLIAKWITLRETQTASDEKEVLDLASYKLKELMRALGFAQIKMKPTKEKTLEEENVFKFRTLLNHRVVKLPDFGSRAGEYRIFTIRHRDTEESIVREALKNDNSSGKKYPNIVIFFGILDVDARCKLASQLRGLARNSQGRYHPTIVLDESLVAFLAAWPGDRQSAFFDCVSAFTSSQPYEPDVARLPPEMFFGRKAERNKIVAMSYEYDMAHFVYGGRRLGKTTLLADIEREYRESPEELVLHFSLKGESLSIRPGSTDDLWHLFAKKLAESRFKIVRPNVSTRATVEKSINRWLQEKEGRRILLLVDEADDFLYKDRQQEYIVLEQIKNLMEDTERRFKVVFAGLHNVQRAANDSKALNTPLAHLGEPICIGAMLPHGTDRHEIESIIREPLEVLGYRLSSDLVIRIAAETNYYPALAQQFCKELLKMHREENESEGEGPPYIIDQDLVDRIFNAKEARTNISKMFEWTIVLDSRYEFLTYLIARMGFDDEYGRPQGMSVKQIRDNTMREWPKGFESDDRYSVFEVLLEEMVGLGILRNQITTSNKQNYTIRTRNLRMLLGDNTEIENKYNAAKSNREPPIFDPAQWRAHWKTTEGGKLLSSFTVRQEERLCYSRGTAVGLVFGTNLAGLDRVSDSLEQMAGISVYHAGPTTLRVKTRQARRAGRKEGITTKIVLVDMRGEWNAEILHRAFQHSGKTKQITRIVLLCNPKDAWESMGEAMPNVKEVELRKIWLEPCGRDFTRAWLKKEDSVVGRDLDREYQMGQLGNKNQNHVDFLWPIVVEKAARNKQLNLDEIVNSAMSEDGHKRCVEDVVNVSECTDIALKILVDYFDSDSLDADTLSELSKDYAGGLSIEEADQFFDWADRLGIVCRRKGRYRLDSTYNKGLAQISENEFFAAVG